MAIHRQFIGNSKAVHSRFIGGRDNCRATLKSHGFLYTFLSLGTLASPKEKKMFAEFFENTIVGGQSGQDGLEYVGLAAIILVVLVVVARMIAQKLQEGGEAATNW